ncbi:MAG: 1-acyl-sn-glycerol-3-phosphate acyltransferase [Acidimicrobiia bacterium]
MPAPRLPDHRPLLVLAETASAFESQQLRDWATEQGVPPSAIIELPSTRRRRRPPISSLLDARVMRSPDALVVPVRMVWMAPERDGRRRVRLIDVVQAVGDPREPDPVRQRWLAFRHPDRMQIVVGEPASAADLVAEWHDSQAASRLGDFVARRAWLALERAERRLRGNRYKVARFVTEEVTAQGDFQAGLAEIAEDLDKPYEAVAARARRLLGEIAATPTTVAIDLIAGLIHLLYRQGYGRISYDRRRLLEIHGTSEHASLVFLPSHKSQLDRLVMQFILWENDLPPSHTAGGINLNFWPVGPLVRRAGVFFIRRSFRDDPTYKFVLRSYLDYLLSRRFPLEWYLEGGRSRTGKLRAPSFGLLHYVIDSFERGMTDDVVLVPASISYDQIQDIGDYAAEIQGASKTDESLGWLVGAIASMRRRYGDVHIRFGEPISLAKEWSGESEEGSIDLARLAFDVMTRINEATPITPTAAISLLLTDDHGPIPVTELTDRIAPLAAEVDRLELPRTARFDRRIDVEVVLERLAEHGFVERTAEGWEVLEGQAHALAFYRNTMIHHLLVPAIVDLAGRVGGDEEATALRVRDLLKFDFFFAPRDAFVASLAGAAATAERIPDLARLVLEPFLETYAAVADLAAEREELPDRRESLAHVRRLLDHGRLRRPEAAMLPIIDGALELLHHKGVEGDRAATAALAAEFADLVAAASPGVERARAHR